jgi:hypothetical protein
MTKSTYFALVSLRTPSLQVLPSSHTIWKGLSPPVWSLFPEPEPPPILRSYPFLNLDTTKLTLVECVRNTPSCHASSMSFDHECTSGSFMNEALNPLSSWVDTSNGVDFPPQKERKTTILTALRPQGLAL